MIDMMDIEDFAEVNVFEIFATAVELHTVPEITTAIVPYVERFDVIVSNAEIISNVEVFGVGEVMTDTVIATDVSKATTKVDVVVADPDDVVRGVTDDIDLLFGDVNDDDDDQTPPPPPPTQKRELREKLIKKKSKSSKITAAAITSTVVKSSTATVGFASTVVTVINQQLSSVFRNLRIAFGISSASTAESTVVTSIPCCQSSYQFDDAQSLDSILKSIHSEILRKQSAASFDARSTSLPDL